MKNKLKRMVKDLKESLKHKIAKKLGLPTQDGHTGSVYISQKKNFTGDIITEEVMVEVLIDKDSYGNVVGVEVPKIN